MQTTLFMASPSTTAAARWLAALSSGQDRCRWGQEVLLVWRGLQERQVLQVLEQVLSIDSYIRYTRYCRYRRLLQVLGA